MATRASKARTDVDLDGQLDLFEGVPDGPLPIGSDQQERWIGDAEAFAPEIAHPTERAGVGRHAEVDRAVLRALEDAFADAREAGDDRPAFVVLAERDRLVLLALVTTGLRRSELCALEWRDLELGAREPSLLVRCGKGSKSRRQPLPASLARELRKVRAARQAEPSDPVFCGLEGGRLQETILADIIRRAAKRAGIEKHVTAHTLRHTAATWLRQELGDTRLVAEYLGHADLSTVTRYAHVDRKELFEAAGRLEELAVPAEEPPAPTDVQSEPANARPDRLPASDSASASPDRSRRRRRRRRRHRRH